MQMYLRSFYSSTDVEKAIKNLAKRQEAKIKSMQEKSEDYGGGMGGERRMNEQYQHHQPHQHHGGSKPPYHCMDEGPPPKTTPPPPPITSMQQPHGDFFLSLILLSGNAKFVRHDKVFKNSVCGQDN